MPVSVVAISGVVRDLKRGIIDRSPSIGCGEPVVIDYERGRHVEIGLALELAGEPEPDAQIVLSRELVGLLSAQLYQSPIKAIEELVVNSYDADANDCWVNVTGSRIVVLDNGIGMDRLGIQDLWHVGHSSKRDEVIVAARRRRQIGKFGIGKLATAAIANRVTYVTKARGHMEDHVLTTGVNYEVFDENPTGASAVPLKVRRISVDDLLAQPGLVDDLTASGCDVESLRKAEEGWTLALLEDLRSEVQQLQTGRLKWVLSTAMPLVADFTLMLGGKKINSSKEDAERVVDFKLHALDPARLVNLSSATKEEWAADEPTGLTSQTFPSGITGRAYVTRQSLYGKSDDLARSHGFFIRVRGRLINLDDPLFGLKPSSHQILNRFYCEIDADDLDTVLTAPRESVELSDTRTKFLNLLNEIFNQARSQYEAWERSRKNERGEPTDKPDKSPEHERNYVNPRLVERPIADALLGAAEKAARDDAEHRMRHGSEDTDEASEAEEEGTAAATTSKSVAEAGWFYLQLPLDFDLPALTKSLYSDEREGSYKYERMNLGRTQPMVRLDPTKATFQINVDHDLVRAQMTVRLHRSCSKTSSRRRPYLRSICARVGWRRLRLRNCS